MSAAWKRRLGAALLTIGVLAGIAGWCVLGYLGWHDRNDPNTDPAGFGLWCIFTIFALVGAGLALFIAGDES